MQKNLSSDLVVTNATEITTEAKQLKSLPVELDASALLHVAGGLPNGTWASTASTVVTSLPNGTW
jgi:purine-nucleoside phosphorylase